MGGRGGGLTPPLPRLRRRACLDQYRACVGLFNSFRVIKCKAYFWASFFITAWNFLCFLSYHFLSIFCFQAFSVVFNSVAAKFQFFYVHYSYCIIMQSRDIEANPGPGGWRSTLSICRWNLNSIWVEDFSKLSQISVFLMSINGISFVLPRLF